MRNSSLLAAVCLFQFGLSAASAAGPGGALAGDWSAGQAKVRPVPLKNVQAGGFLGGRIALNARSVLKGLESPIPRRFETRIAGREPGSETNRLASDSDLYKWIEGASYMVALTGDAEVEKQLERIAGLVIACQKPDGYINTQVPPNVRFDTRINHDLYTAGHFFEAAVVHYRATGRTTLLAAAARWADYLISEYKAGNPYFKTIAEKEHSEYELGLLRLSRATGQRKYLDFATTLASAIPVGPQLLLGPYAANAHAVRVNYLLTGHADIYLETGKPDIRQNLFDLWDTIVSTRSFVTGGVSVHERYQKEPYYLPQVTDHPRRDIAETCTSIALMMFGWRLHAMDPDNRFFDQIENILYNHYLGAISLDNLGTFYYNPLKLAGDLKDKTDHDAPIAHRTMLPAIHSTSCCITNEWRFFGALSEYLFSYDDSGLYVNLYTAGKVKQKLPSGGEAALAIETNYPHDALISLRMDNAAPARYALHLRVPQWCDSATLTAPGQKTRRVPGGEYTVVDRLWKHGDRVTLNLEMPVRMVLPHPRDKESAGQAVLARGPLIYCLEQVDCDFPIDHARWAIEPPQVARAVSVSWKAGLLNGVNVLTAPATVDGKPRKLTLVPFYARANRSDDNRWMTFLPLAAQ